MNGIDAEIGEMLESVGEKVAEKQADEKTDEKDEAKISVAGDDKEQEHIDEPEPEPEPKEDPVIKAIMEKNAALEKKLDEMMAKLSTPQADRPAEKVEEQKPAIVDYFTDDGEFDKVFEKKDELNKMLNKVRQSAIEQVLTMMPTVTRDVINAQVVLAVKTAKFYEANPDLAQHAKVAEATANEIMGREPGLSMDQLFERLGKEVRDKVGLQKKAEVKADEKEKIDSQKPAFGRTGGSRKPAVKEVELTELEKQIDDLLKE